MAPWIDPSMSQPVGYDENGQPYWIDPASGTRLSMPPEQIAQIVQQTGQTSGNIDTAGGPQTAPEWMQHEGAAKWMRPVVLGTLGAMAGYGALGAAGLLGANALGGGVGAAAAAPEAATLGGAIPSWGGAAAGGGLELGGAIPAMAPGWGSGTLGALGSTVPTMGMAAPALAGDVGFGAGLSAAGAAATAPGAASVPSASSWLSQAGQYLSPAGKLLSAVGGGSGQSQQSPLGGAIGAGLGGLLGYLDAKNQPKDITITQNIDPRLGNLAYGPGGVGEALTSTLNSQLGKTYDTPDWSTLVNQSKSQWDANPYLDKMVQQTADGITGQMGAAGFGSGSFGNTGLGSVTAKALADSSNSLRYNAFSDWQNRALQGAQSAGTYGLNANQQKANLPWVPVMNASAALGQFPGSKSTTQPLFINPLASAIGGASTGATVGGGTDWGQVIGGIGDIFKNWKWS